MTADRSPGRARTPRLSDIRLSDIVLVTACQHGVSMPRCRPQDAPDPQDPVAQVRYQPAGDAHRRPR